MVKEKKGERKEIKIKGNSLGASGFTLGIVSIWFMGYYGIVISILAFIFCFIQQKKKPTKLGKAGLILSIIGFALSILWIFYFAPMLTSYLEQSGAFPIS